MHEVCPEASQYDSQVNEKYQARLEIKTEEKTKALKEVCQQALRAGLNSKLACKPDQRSLNSRPSQLSLNLNQVQEYTKKDVLDFMHLFLKRRLRQIKGKEMSEEQLLKASKEQHDIEGLLHVMTSGEKTQPRNVAADLAAFLQKTRANTTPMASSFLQSMWVVK